MKFCSKCGKHYSDENAFCGKCGIELTAMEKDSVNTFESIKENAGNVASAFGDKAKDIFSEENTQKIKDQVQTATNNFKNFDIDNGKNIVNGISNSGKLIIAAIGIIIISYIGYYFLSPTKQVERAFYNSVEIMTKVAATPNLGDWSDSDIKTFCEVIVVKSKREQAMQDLLQRRERAKRRYTANEATLPTMMGGMVLEGCKIRSISIDGDRATLDLESKTGAPLGKQFMRKVEDQWFIER